MNRKINVALALTIVLGLGWMLLPGAGFCAYPVDKLTIVVPYPTGGTTDRLARARTPALSKQLGVPVTIANREGGGSIVGIKAHLKNDPADGSFIVYQIQPYLSGGIIKGAWKLSDFDYLGLDYWSPQSIWVRKDSKYKTLEQLFEAIKTDPKKIKHAYLPNSWALPIIALLKERIGAEPKAIPYQGGGPQRLAIIAGDVDFGVTELYGTRAAAEADLKPLCVFDTARVTSAYPETPTINEVMKKMGLKAMPIVSNFRFYLVKKGFKQKYPDRWDTLVKAMQKASADPEFKDILSKQKLVATWKGPEECERAVVESDQFCQQFKAFFKFK
ncbi:MAG: tripartite tricarboxylate transporter substrate binding protein [Pseudomonadota bacterium]